jgi:membrane dipeptidase
MGALGNLAAGSDPRLSKIFEASLVWDNHGCMPLRPDDEDFLPQLARYRAAGVDVVSLNVGFDAVPWENTVRILAHFRSWVRRHSDRYALIETVDDIEVARRNGKLAVTFDIEGGGALDGRLEMVELYYNLGVRWMLFAYNKNNLLGGGCKDDDSGLTAFGGEVLAEMERVGMVPCCSHTGYRTTMQVMERARGPVIFSHSNPAALWPHRRNIGDQAIKACAATGGVVGINGIGLFLGHNDASTETIVRHIDYVVQLVGPNHVGIGLDYVFDQEELETFVRKNPEIFPPSEYGNAPQAFVRPEQLPEIVEHLSRLGYDEAALSAILGGNHLRVARQTWRLPDRKGLLRSDGQ